MNQGLLVLGGESYVDVYFVNGHGCNLGWAIDKIVEILTLLKSLKNALPMNRNAQPYEIANLVCFLLSDDSSIMTGSLCSVDGGYTCQ